MQHIYSSIVAVVLILYNFPIQKKIRNTNLRLMKSANQLGLLPTANKN